MIRKKNRYLKSCDRISKYQKNECKEYFTTVNVELIMVSAHVAANYVRSIQGGRLSTGRVL